MVMAVDEDSALLWQRNPSGRATPVVEHLLLAACSAGNVAVVETLLGEKVDIDAQDPGTGALG